MVKKVFFILVYAYCRLLSFAQSPPVITVQPESMSVVLGTKVTLKVAVDGVGPFSYQWLRAGTNLPNNIITTFAGGRAENGIPAVNSKLTLPVGVSVDLAGNVFIADQFENLVRKVDVNGIITAVAGNGPAEYSIERGGVTNAVLSSPNSTAVSPSGNLFIADRANNRVLKMDKAGLFTGVAGGGDPGFTGDGGPSVDARLSNPVHVATDNVGNLYITDQFNHRIRKVGTNGIITTIAGNGTASYSGDGGLATNASLNRPAAVAVNSSGVVFIADQSNYRIRKVDTNGVISTVAGNGTASFSSEGIQATNAGVIYPAGVAVDGAGNLFIIDGNRVRKVGAGGFITTFAGNIASGYSGDGGAATNASLLGPSALALDSKGRLLIADQSNRRIRRVDTNGIISTVAGGDLGDGGSATNANLTIPSGVLVDGSGNLLIVDEGNHRIRKVTSDGIITTFAGAWTSGFSGDGNAATNSWLASPAGVCRDAYGNVFIADRFNHRIRRVGTNGIITTIAGNGSAGFSGDGGSSTNAKLNRPADVAVDAVGNLLIADQFNNRIRMVDATGAITTVAGGGTNSLVDGTKATNASLSQPIHITPAVDGSVYITQLNVSRVYRIDSNNVLTIEAGTGAFGYSGDGGLATIAELAYPSGMALDESGSLFIADQWRSRIRKVDGAGVITTIAGNGIPGLSGDGGVATNANLNYPAAVAFDGSDFLYIADTVNNRVRMMVLTDSPALGFKMISAGDAGDYQVVVTSPYGSVTSRVATVTVVNSTNQSAVIAMGTPMVAGSNLVLGFSLSQGVGSAFTLLQATNVTGPWMTNSSAVLTTNGAGGGFRFTVPVPDPAAFYQVRSP